MLAGVAFIVIVLVGPYVLWKGWLRLYPGISLRQDYGIQGGWFGAKAFIGRLRSTTSRGVGG
jgi:hypothetical protein